MSAFHQLGHHSESMVLEDGLRAYAGAILSPVNYTHDETVAQCARFREAAPDLDIWFDPQLYVPRTDRQKLREWGLAGDGFETADLTSAQWWQRLAGRRSKTRACRSKSRETTASGFAPGRSR